MLLLPLILVPLDALARWWRGQPGGLPRVLMLVVVFGTGVPTVWLLSGAPWTSLEWTRGGALRYALPWFLLGPFLAWIGLFPASLPWYRHPAAAATLGGLAAATSVMMVTGNQAIGPFPPAVTWPTVLLAVGMLWLLRFGYPASRRLAIAAALGALIGWAAWLTDWDEVARNESRLARAAMKPTTTQRLYEAVLHAERTLGRDCSRRRFFALTRFDEPLGVQSVGYQNLVFYAARDVQVTARVVAPMGSCDYIVSARQRLETSKGAQLVRVLSPHAQTVELGDVGRFVLLGQR